MAKLSILAGTISKTVKVFVQDSSLTTGAGLPGLVFNTASLSAYYIREGVAGATLITLVTATQGTWTSSGFIVVDATHMPGLYELSLPNAAIAAGAKSVVVYLFGATNMSPCVLEIELTAVDNQDAVRFGQTALPNAAFDAAAGLFSLNSLNTGATHNTQNSVGTQIRQGAGGQTTAIRTGTAQTGSTSSTIKLDSGASATNNIYVGATVVLTGGTGAGQSRRIIAYVGATKVATVDSNWVATPDNTTTFEIDSSPNAIVATEGVAQAGAASTITLATTSSGNDNFYNGSFITIQSGTGSGQTREISGYVGATKVATVSSNWSVNPDSTSAYAVIPSGSASQPITFIAPTVGQIASSILLNPANLLLTDSSGRVTTTYYIKKNVAAAKFPFVMTSATTHAPLPALAVTATRSLDGAAFAACANAVVELANGAYVIDLAAADLNANTVMLRLTATGADDLFIAVVTQ